MKDDGVNWMTVRYSVDVRVMADSDEEALLFAGLALPDYDLQDYSDGGEVVER